MYFNGIEYPRRILSLTGRITHISWFCRYFAVSKLLITLEDIHPWFMSN